MSARENGQLFGGLRMAKPPEPREVEITGGPHPFGRGHCSCCHDPAPTGVAVRAKGRDPAAGAPYVFICAPCVRRIAEVCP